MTSKAMPVKLLTKSGKNFYRIYIVRPPGNSDTGLFAEQLMGIDNVEEVLVTDGDCGFVVKARFCGSEPDRVLKYISEKVGGNFGSATSHYHYKRGRATNSVTRSVQLV